MLSGWIDKTYVSAARKHVKQKPVILGLDNPWLGTIRQRALTVAAPAYIHRFCNRAWVAGSSQYEYARRLGFHKNQIVDGLYSADTGKFYQTNGEVSMQKAQSYPNKIVYVGRLVEYKQPHVLARLFNEIITKYQLNWKLVLAGEGPLKETILQQRYPQVEVTGFISPSALPEFYADAGIFCLPSKGEHWGVAVQEAAAAGLPLLLSDSVESGSRFLLHGFNGVVFRSGNDRSLKAALLNLLTMPSAQLLEMGRNSIGLSKRINHDTWAATLKSIIEEPT